MKTKNLNDKLKAPSGGSLDRLVGQSYVFMRENHDWHSCEVSVLAAKGKNLTVARCCDVCDGLLAPKGSPKRKLKTWTCTKEELW